MITSLADRRIPKRKDRYTSVIALTLISLVILTFPFWGRFLPGVDEFVVNQIATYLIIVFFIIGMGTNVYVWWRLQSKWEALATQIGLNVESYKPNSLTFLPWPRIIGLYRGHQLKVERFTKYSGRRRKTHTSISLQFEESSQEQLFITPRGFLPRLGDIFKMQDVKLHDVIFGYDEFDRSLAVRSTSDYFAKSVLVSQGIRQGLIELKPQAPDMQLAILSKDVHYQERTSITDTEYMLAVINLLVDITDYAKRYRQQLRTSV